MPLFSRRVENNAIEKASNSHDVLFSVHSGIKLRGCGALSVLKHDK